MVIFGCGKKKAFMSANKPLQPKAEVLLEVDVQDDVADCDKGGAIVTTGLDYNENGEIEADEIVDTEVVCTKFYIVKECDEYDSDFSDDDSESSDD